MAKFSVQMYYRVDYSYDTEIEADTEQEAEQMARDIFNNANVEAEWGSDDGDLEIDITEEEDQ